MEPVGPDGQAFPPLPFEHSRDNWRVPTAQDARGSYEVTARLPGSELSCRVYGRPESALRGWVQPAEYHQVEFPSTSFGLGLGALGTSRSEAAARLGELVAADGAVAHLPTQGAQVPDFDVGLGGRAAHRAPGLGLRLPRTVLPAHQVFQQPRRRSRSR